MPRNKASNISTKMLFSVLFKVVLLHLCVEEVFATSFPRNEVVIQDQGQGILSKPSAYIIGANRTTLVVCRANLRGISNIVNGPVDDFKLLVKCKGLRHKVRLQFFSTSDDDTPSVTTARLIVLPNAIKKYKQHIICYCIDVSTKEKSSGLEVAVKPAKHFNRSLTLTHFKPNRNRLRTVTFLSYLKISWRFPNSSVVHCLHDGATLAEDQMVRGEGKISVVIKEALRKDAGFYYCRSKTGVFSSWLKLQVKGGWSKWLPWLDCSTRCGEGKKIEIRRCLETRLERCQGPSVRALPCVGSCEGMMPQFIDEPADQVLSSGSSTNVTCAAEFGSTESSVPTVHLFCSSNKRKISYFMIQNQTTGGSVSNNTVARITYSIELHRYKNDLAAMVYCQCYAFNSQLTKKSRIAEISFPSGMMPQFIDEPADQVISSGSSTNVMCAVQFGSIISNVPTLHLFCSSNEWTISYFMIQNQTAGGSVSNNTVARITYNIELHRYKNDLTAMVYCQCYAFTSQLTKKSRIAEISFSSVQKAPDEDKISSSVWNGPYILTGIIFVVVTGLVLVVSLSFRIYTKRMRSEPYNTESCSTEVTITSRRRLPIIESCETNKERHFEPPNRKVMNLHSNVSSGDEASDGPLLNYHLEEPSALIDCKSQPSADSGAEIDCDNESVFQRGESWKSNKSAFSSVSAGFCPKPKLPDTIDPDLCAWGQFTEKGGRLTIAGTGISLYIPPNALPEQTSQVMYIGLMNSKGQYPKLNNQEALLSPVVVCGPDGLTFDKPVFLTIPHNAVLDEKNCWNPKVQSCSTVDEEEGENSNKWKVLERPGGDAPLSHVSDKCMQIMVDHFTNFVVVGQASSCQEASAQLKSWVIAYFNEPKVDEDCITRVYCIPATDAAYKVLEGIESKLNGKMSDAPKLLQISNNNKNLQITSKMIHEGWSAVTGEQKTIPFYVIWQCTEQSPNVSFIFERVSPQVFKFRSTFDARQEELDIGVEVLVSFSIKDIRRASSGYETQVNGCQIDAQYKIPMEIRGELCDLLDPEHPFFLDWRLLAEKLEMQKAFIDSLKGNPKIKSPTYEVIEIWEMTLSEQKPLSRLKEILCEMKRHDVVQVLQKIPGLELENTNGEISC